MRPCAAALLSWCVAASAQTVSLSGSLGNKALLMIDGKPHTLAAGSSFDGVKLLAVDGSAATVEIQGKRVALAIGGAQVDMGAADSGGGGRQIVLAMGSGGHFYANGTINGKSTRFMVDTGATFVAMGVDEAQRLGIDFRAGERSIANTANGRMVVYRVMLGSIRIGDVQIYNVEALVGQAPMDAVLLGNSFLARFQMKQDNDIMTLSRRY